MKKSLLLSSSSNENGSDEQGGNLTPTPANAQEGPRLVGISLPLDQPNDSFKSREEDITMTARSQNTIELDSNINGLAFNDTQLESLKNVPAKPSILRVVVRAYPKHYTANIKPEEPATSKASDSSSNMDTKELGTTIPKVILSDSSVSSSTSKIMNGMSDIDIQSATIAQPPCETAENNDSLIGNLDHNHEAVAIAAAMAAATEACPSNNDAPVDFDAKEFVTPVEVSECIASSYSTTPESYSSITKTQSKKGSKQKVGSSIDIAPDNELEVMNESDLRTLCSRGIAEASDTSFFVFSALTKISLAAPQSSRKNRRKLCSEAELSLFASFTPNEKPFPEEAPKVILFGIGENVELRGTFGSDPTEKFVREPQIYIWISPSRKFALKLQFPVETNFIYEITDVCVSAKEAEKNQFKDNVPVFTSEIKDKGFVTIHGETESRKALLNAGKGLNHLEDGNKVESMQSTSVKNSSSNEIYSSSQDGLSSQDSPLQLSIGTKRKRKRAEYADRLVIPFLGIIPDWFMEEYDTRHEIKRTARNHLNRADCASRDIDFSGKDIGESSQVVDNNNQPLSDVAEMNAKPKRRADKKPTVELSLNSYKALNDCINGALSLKNYAEPNGSHELHSELDVGLPLLAAAAAAAASADGLRQQRALNYVDQSSTFKVINQNGIASFVSSVAEPLKTLNSRVTQSIGAKMDSAAKADAAATPDLTNSNINCRLDSVFTAMSDFKNSTALHSNSLQPVTVSRSISKHPNYGHISTQLQLSNSGILNKHFSFDSIRGALNKTTGNAVPQLTQAQVEAHAMQLYAQAKADIESQAQAMLMEAQAQALAHVQAFLVEAQALSEVRDKAEAPHKDSKYESSERVPRGSTDSGEVANEASKKQTSSNFIKNSGEIITEAKSVLGIGGVGSEPTNLPTEESKICTIPDSNSLQNTPHNNVASNHANSTVKLNSPLELISEPSKSNTAKQHTASMLTPSQQPSTSNSAYWLPWYSIEPRTSNNDQSW